MSSSHSNRWMVPALISGGERREGGPGWRLIYALDGSREHGVRGPKRFGRALSMPRVRIVLIETFVLLGIVASSHHAFAKKPVASLCNNGRFITNAPPLVSSQVDIAGFFSLTLTPASSGKATLVVPGCTPITVKLQAGGKKSTNVK